MGRDIDAVMDAGIHALRESRREDAIAAFQRAAELDPTSARPHSYLAVAWLINQCLSVGSKDEHYAKEARKALHRTLELDPQNWESLVQLGFLSMNEGKLDEARTWYEMASEAKPLDADTWYALGAVARRKFSMGPMADARAAIDQAIADLSQALTLDPNHADATRALAWFLEERARRNDKEPARRPDLAAAIDLRRRFRQLEAEAKRNWKCQRPDETDRDYMLHEWARMAAHPWLMRDPPTCPPGSGRPQKRFQEPSIRFEPVE